MNVVNASGSEKKVVILDPSSGTANLGDQIISEAVRDIVFEVSEDNTRLLSISVHQKPSKAQINLLSDADVILAGGSNLINFRYWPFRDARWNNTLFSLLKMKNVVFLGVGASSATDRSNFFGRYLYGGVLSKRLIHSVRDEFTAQVMRSRGFSNVLNTTCPTMWRLSNHHMEGIPSFKSSKAVFTLTDYHRDPASDRVMIDEILKIYDDVYFWPQGYYDFQYFRSLGDFHNVSIISPDLSAYDNFLRDGGVDYIGTRLHAGIRALQNKCRALVVSIDNRAKEISRDTGLLTVSRDNITQIRGIIERGGPAKIMLPEESINRWKSQLRDILRG